MSRVQSRGSRVKVEVEGKSRGSRVKVEGIYIFFSVSNSFDICLNNKVHEVR